MLLEASIISDHILTVCCWFLLFVLQSNDVSVTDQLGGLRVG